MVLVTFPSLHLRSIQEICQFHGAVQLLIILAHQSSRKAVARSTLLTVMAAAAQDSEGVCCAMIGEESDRPCNAMLCTSLLCTASICHALPC